MSNNQNQRSQGVTFAGALGLLFIGLKLGHIIKWSWWLVTLPLWAGLAVAVVCLVLAGLLLVIAELAKAAKGGR